MIADTPKKDGWCHCCLAIEDPLHPSWHAITVWNKDVFEEARRRKQEEFDRLIGVKQEKPKRKKREKRYVPLPGEATGP